jgi:acetamidase/formamidase
MQLAVLLVAGRRLPNSRSLIIAKAFSIASIAVDFHVTEVVDGTQVATGYIPKSLFLKK